VANRRVLYTPSRPRAIQAEGGPRSVCPSRSERSRLTAAPCSWRSSRTPDASAASNSLSLPPGSPKLNGHVERAQRTHKEEFYHRLTSATTLTQVNKLLRRWEDVHNCYRPHQALGQTTHLWRSTGNARRKEGRAYGIYRTSTTAGQRGHAPLLSYSLANCAVIVCRPTPLFFQSKMNGGLGVDKERTGPRSANASAHNRSDGVRR